MKTGKKELPNFAKNLSCTEVMAEIFSLQKKSPPQKKERKIDNITIQLVYYNYMVNIKENLIEKIQPYLTPSNIKRMAKFFNALKSYEKGILNYAIEYTILKNQSRLRKTGLPNVTHPLNVAIRAIKQKLHFNIVIASLLHDIVEDQIEEKIQEIPLKKKRKSDVRIKLRKYYFDIFLNDMNQLQTRIKKHSAKNNIQEIIKLVDILTRYNDPNQHYYHYIQTHFSVINKRYDKKIIYQAILLKCIDRIDNILSMDTKLRGILNDKIKVELKIIKLLESNKLQEQYKNLLSEQNSLIIDYSFSGGARLNQIWKNTYLLIHIRQFFCTNQKLDVQKKGRIIETELINSTLKVLIHHKNSLQLHIPQETTDYWDNLAKNYNEIGGFNGHTPSHLNPPKISGEYTIFNSTLEIFSQYLLKNNLAFKKLQFDKETQYTYLAVIHEMLNKFKSNPDFICDISKEIQINSSKNKVK